MSIPGFKDEWARAAIFAARESTCAKSRRGAALVHPEDLDKIFVASNGPPKKFKCTGSGACRDNCNKVAVHAEERLLIRHGNMASGFHLVHAKVDEHNELVSSGPPSCWQCSRMIVEAEIDWVWLYSFGFGNKWIPYQATEFHELTLEHNGLPTVRTF
ncbi:hypothetical protein LCGC14_2050790 [marine sediment metagenome]|uniref:CMP/dCMP-type deaminase domain-containing protein n=1 Tax=marine sediment metagenome TaxID=412755 RepID=A0A0F9HL34_9ZZZZ